MSHIRSRLFVGPSAPVVRLLFVLCAGQFVRATAADPPTQATLIGAKGTVEILRDGTAKWERSNPADIVRTNLVLRAGDQVRTQERSRAKLRLADGSVLDLDELSRFRIEQKEDRGLLELMRGALRFFHRSETGQTEVKGNGVSAIVRGTEFTFAVADDGRVQLALFDGEVDLANPLGRLNLKGSGVAEASPTTPPARTAALEGLGGGAIQWMLYYPGILSLPELAPANAFAPELEPTLGKYRRGDLLGALAAYPAGRQPADREERVLLAGLVLSVGNVREAVSLLSPLHGDDSTARLADALRTVIDTTLGAAPRDAVAATRTPATATEWLAASYARQARHDLPGAIAAARNAVALRPEFGFGWVRVAELEFGFGRVGATSAALAKALDSVPDNAQAIALRGFVLAAQYHPTEAETAFADSIGRDPGLGNAWLGRGLMRIHRGQLAEGLSDLTVAAASEPNRSLLRSYLAKAYTSRGDETRARHELDLAGQLDPLDPTVWLYRALLLQQAGSINAAIRAYGGAEARNQERALYRSGLLLDQDRAVVGANRATAYRDAGLTDFAVREAGRALAVDPANPSAHLFLAESFLNDSRVNLRYETPRVGEYLQANLLAPVGGGMLSANLSQQDYSRLFEQDGLHVFSQTAYRSSGGWEEAGGFFGTHGRLGHLADAYYVRDPGFAPNTDFEQTAFEAQLKVQAGERDTLYAQVLRAESDAGDLASYTDPASARTTLRVKETLEPVLLGGWHRAWGPDHHTLLLAGWLRTDQTLADSAVALNRFATNHDGTLGAMLPLGSSSQTYSSRENWFSTEAQHLWHTELNSLVGGVRYQHADLDARNVFDGIGPAGVAPGVSPKAERLQGYVYDTVRPWASFQITAGLSYDVVTSPVNFRSGPLSDASQRVSRGSPKAGFVWSPRTNVWLRGAYTRSLGGIGAEQSVRLEPTQIAGFNQAYRSLAPESLVGALSAAEMETWQVALETRLATDTFLALQAERLVSGTDAPQGIFRGTAGNLAAVQTPVRIAYEERALAFSAAQLAGRHWSFVARYRWSVNELDTRWLDMGSLRFGLPGVGLLVPTESTLHAVTLGTRFNHESGWFAGADATWYAQPAGDAADYNPAPHESVWQTGVFVGHRFWQRRAEVLVGVENLLDQDYRIHPLGGLANLPRERTAVVRLKWVW